MFPTYGTGLPCIGYAIKDWVCGTHNSGIDMCPRSINPYDCAVFCCIKHPQVPIGLVGVGFFMGSPLAGWVNMELFGDCVLPGIFTGMGMIGCASGWGIGRTINGIFCAETSPRNIEIECMIGGVVEKMPGYQHIGGVPHHAIEIDSDH